MIVGAGLIGSLMGLNLLQKGYKVLVVDKDISKPKDLRTLAVNANSKDFLINLGVGKLKNKPQKINKIIIKDHYNKEPLIFENNDEEMVMIFNSELLSIARIKANKSILEISSLNLNDLHCNKVIQFNKKKYSLSILFYFCKKFNDEYLIKNILAIRIMLLLVSLNIPIVIIKLPRNLPKWFGSYLT